MKDTIIKGQFFDYFAYYTARFTTAPLWLAFVALMVASLIAREVLDMLRDVAEFISEQAEKGVKRLEWACHAAAPFPLFRVFLDEWSKADHERREKLLKELGPLEP